VRPVTGRTTGQEVAVGLFKNLKGVKDAMAAGMRGEGPSEEALASLTPEQRAAYDAQMARVEASQSEAVAASQQIASDHQARVQARPLRGPAGEYVFGPDATGGLSADQMASMSQADLMAWSKDQAKAGFKDLLRNPMGRPAAPPTPAPVPGASADPAQQAAAERAARDRARAPYLAPERTRVTFTRLSTRGGTQLDEVAAYLASSGLGAHPDRVYGVYRVPDAIGLGTLAPERSRYVEWDIVHAGLDGVSPEAPEPGHVFFDGGEHWVGRTVGEPSVLDEELGVRYLAAAGIGPDQTFGVARHLRVRSIGGGDDSSSVTMTMVTGASVLHAGAPAATFDEIRAARPIALEAADLAGVRVDVLNWGVVASAVHPANQKAVPVPSPFPYLPSTPQELLKAYLEVVGIHPAHCYAAQVTEDEARSIDGTGRKGGMDYTTNVGEKLPCADGKARRRLFGGTVLVVAYLDAPAYGNGRARWSRYEDEVLQASLFSATGARRPVEEPAYDDLPRGLRGLAKMAEKVDAVFDGDTDPWADIAPHRYCWPPQRA